jgi:deazaflavin-dependent oxidoreductase (nitroreductase family)
MAMTLSHRARTVVLALALGALAIEAVLVVVFRTKWAPAIDAVRRANRDVLNPLMLRRAGRGHWYAAVVHHVGRTSGRAYSTPVLAEPAGGRLYLPLPYGTHVDWCRNVLAAGGCVVERQGERLAAVKPVLVPAAEAAAALRPATRAVLALYGVDTYLRLDVVG